MPIYHFNVTDGHAVAVDSEGSDLTDEAEARTEALASARLLMATSDEQGRCRRHWRMDVTTDAGRPVLSLPFSHALVADVLPASGFDS